jgi:hypothetical protein
VLSHINLVEVDGCELAAQLLNTRGDSLALTAGHITSANIYTLKYFQKLLRSTLGRFYKIFQHHLLQVTVFIL